MKTIVGVMVVGCAIGAPAVFAQELLRQNVWTFKASSSRGSPGPAWKEFKELTSGVTITVPVAPLPPGTEFLLLEDQYTLDVPEGSESVWFELIADDLADDFDLFVRFESPVAMDGTQDPPVVVADAIAILGHLFGGSGALPDPFQTPGLDPTEDVLSCRCYRATPCVR